MEAETLKRNYENALRLLRSRKTSALHGLIQNIQNETILPLELVVDYSFTNEPGDKLGDHSPIFAAYNSQLASALLKDRGTAEYSNWQFRYKDFQRTRPDFRIRALLTEGSLVVKDREAATQTIGSAATAEKFKITVNDRRFLRSLRIAADEPADKP